MSIFKTKYKWKLDGDKQTKRHITTTKFQQFIIGLFGNIYQYIVISFQCRALYASKAALILVTSSGVIWWKRPFFQIGTETKRNQRWYCLNLLVLKPQHSGKCRTLGLLMLCLLNYVVWTGLCWKEFNHPRRTGHLSENKFTTRVIKGLLNPDYTSASFIVDRYGNGSTYPPLYNWLFSFKTVIPFYHIDHCNCNIHAWNWSNTMNI